LSDEEQAPPGRSFWSGTISIGLVNVPVKLYTMIRDQSYSFHFLRKRDGCPLKYQRICTYDNEVVEWGDVARGYEVQKSTSPSLRRAGRHTPRVTAVSK
jgi:non-homologous end joining protein Ku